MMFAAFPVVDLFAGPGGLGEGFASLQASDGEPIFQNIVSIEKDRFAYQTLLLRHFFRSFPRDEVPDEYYSYLAGDLGRAELEEKFKAEFRHARLNALQINLAPDVHDNVRRNIKARLDGRRKWALVGGPPCQAYSLVGRSRMMGNPDFESDPRHFLYKEYLQIIIDHQPPMMNVQQNIDFV